MADSMRYLRHRRDRAQRRVLAVTVTCGAGATALTVAFGALLAAGEPAVVDVLPVDNTQHAHTHTHPEDSAEPATHAHSHSAPEESPEAAPAPDRPDGRAVRGGDSPAAHEHSPAAHRHEGD